MPAFGGAQIKIGESDVSVAPETKATPAKTGGAFGGMKIEIGEVKTPAPEKAAAAATAPVKPLPTEIKPVDTSGLFKKSAEQIKQEKIASGIPKDIAGREETIGQDMGTGKPMSKFQSVLAEIPFFNAKGVTGKNNAINSKLVMAMSDAWDAFSSRSEDFIRSLDSTPSLDPTKTYDPAVQAAFSASGEDEYGNPVDRYGNRTITASPLERTAKGIGAATALTGLVFSPLTGAAKQAEDIPVAGRAVHAFNWTVENLGKAVTWVAEKGVDQLPISDKAKETIRGPIGEVAALVAQIWVGKVAAEKGVPIAQKKMAEVTTKLTKDIIDHTVPGKTVTIEPNQVRDILTGVLSKGEERDLYLSLGRDAKTIRNDIKQGVKIEVPKESFKALVDKPYWSKIKQALGFPEAEPILFGRTGGPASANPLVRYLPEPGKATPEILTKEIIDAIESHGEQATLQALHDNLGVTPVMATRLVNEAKAMLALKAPEEFLQLNAPAGVPKAFAGAKVEIGNVVDANKALNEANTKKVMEDTMAGKREDKRLDTPEQIEKSSTVLPEKATPETRVTIYRAAAEEIKGGDHVTLSEANAKKYASQREGSTVQKIEVPIKDLVKSEGIGNEFVYAPKTRLKPVGGGERVASELASGIEARAIEKKLSDKPFESLSTHERAVMEDQREAAGELYKTDPEKAKAVALGEANAPEGMLPSVIYQKVVEQAELAGDIDLMMKLATSPFNEEITAMAQNIRGLAEFRNKTSPTEIIKKVSKERKAAVEKKAAKAGSVAKAKEKVVERGRKAIAKSAKKSPIQLKQVEEFISLLEC